MKWASSRIFGLEAQYLNVMLILKIFLSYWLNRQSYQHLLVIIWMIMIVFWLPKPGHGTFYKKINFVQYISAVYSNADVLG
jgi:hypothetical protein